MVAAYPVRFPDQLRQHLRALRKRHGLTQAQLGALVGVSQARIAEIEANPGLVNFEQLMKLLSVLGTSFTLQEATTAAAVARASSAKASRPKTALGKSKVDPVARIRPQVPTRDTGARPAKRPLVVHLKKGSW